MALLKRPLPIGLQTFSTMIEDDYIYIDKTSYMYQLISTGRYYFLSRPRRFGKSLLITTLEELFRGNRKLFKSLNIDSTDYVWKEHPVIVLNFASLEAASPEILKKDLAWTISNIGRRYGIDLSEAPSLTTQFKFLIQEMGKREKVVLLVDEYDYPIIRNIADPAIAESCREVLRDFFSSLKDTDVDKHLRFVFITGVSKFSKTSVFSGLNNLRDISLSPLAAKLLGYTIEEITHYYKDYLDKISAMRGVSVSGILSQLGMWYNGYQFTDPKEAPDAKMYNPFSVMLYLSDGVFRNFWFETGTPTFLMRLMKQQNYPLLDNEQLEVSTEEMRIDDVNKISLMPMLWQTGYLTIESYNPEADTYRLRFPNREVRVSFYQSLLRELSDKNDTFVKSTLHSLNQSLEKAQLEKFFKTVQSFFAQIPYTVQLPQEKYYQSILYVLMKILGAEIVVEDATNNGRIDAVIENSGNIFIFELKVHEDSKKALEQIEIKDYSQKFLNSDKVIHLIGVQFDLKQRNIGQWLSKIMPRNGE